MSSCGSCSTYNAGEWRFCPNCGAKNTGAQQTSTLASDPNKGFGSGVITRPDTRESTAYAKVDLNQRKIGGLDDDLAAKRNASYDVGLEQACRVWLEKKTGQQVTGDLHTFLKNGVFLCNLSNSLKPNSVPAPKTSSMPFIQMENVNKFLTFCSNSGVASLSLFQTVDLYENKNMGQVVLCLSALSRIYP